MSRRFSLPGTGVIAIATLAVAAGALGLIALHQWRRQGELATRVALLEADKHKLLADRDALARENEALRSRLAELGEPEPPVPRPVPSTGLASSVEQVRLLVKLQEQLAAAQRAFADAEARSHDLEEKLSRAQEENKTLSSLLDEAKEKLAGQSRVLEALQAELKTKTDRLAQLETTNLLLHKQNRQAADESARLRKLLAEIEEINRRRENLLSGLLRRYRELADQLRNFATRPESQAGPAAADSPELVRLQNTLVSAEEDLRQLSNLNAQAARLQRELVGR
ncbi:MAG: hypothetical protein ACP5U2_02205 [Bryobacteraceae bacterium]